MVRSTDYGVDEPSAQALLARHRDLEGQIRAYEGDVQSLNSQADRLAANGVTSLILSDPSTLLENTESKAEPIDEWIDEIRMVPEEYYEEEPQERTEYRTVTEERLVPQVKAIYAFEGQGMSMAKGEVCRKLRCGLTAHSICDVFLIFVKVLFLLNQTNDDWWHVRKGSGKDGFVPANYVKEIEGKRIPVQVRQPFTVKDVKRVKRTRMVKKIVKVKKPKLPPKPPSTAVHRQHSRNVLLIGFHLICFPGRKGAAKDAPKEDNVVELVLQRKRNINDTYEDIVKLAKVSGRSLFYLSFCTQFN